MSDEGALPTSHVLKAFVVDGDALLLVQRPMGDPPHAGLWDLPSAIIEGGETDAEALKRGIWEESGLIAAVAEMPFTEAEYLHPPKKPQRRLLQVAYLAICESNPAGLKSSEYAAQVKWVAFDNLVPNVLDGRQRYRLVPGTQPLVDNFIGAFVKQD